MIGLIALLVLAPQSSPPEVAQFKAAYAVRQGEIPPETPDPAIAECLDILLRTVEAKLRAHPTAAEKEIERWVEPFSQALAKPHEDGPAADEYRSLSVRASVVGGWRFVTARMGTVTRTDVFDRAWRQFTVPAELTWSTPWDRLPILLPLGLILVYGDSIQAAGMRVGVRLVWLKRQGRRLRKVGEFEAQTTLDFEAPEVRGDRVTEHTVDSPKTFWVSSSTPVLGRLTTWDCSSGRPLLAGVRLLHPTLRAIDGAALAARNAKNPTALQMQIRKLWLTSGELGDDLGRWSEKRLAGGIVRVTCNGDVEFDLATQRGGFRVVAVRKVKAGVAR
jgi:hypothetical protein